MAGLLRDPAGPDEIFFIFGGFEVRGFSVLPTGLLVRCLAEIHGRKPRGVEIGS